MLRVILILSSFLQFSASVCASKPSAYIPESRLIDTAKIASRDRSYKFINDRWGALKRDSLRHRFTDSVWNSDSLRLKELQIRYTSDGWVFTPLETTMAEFPGGQKALNKFLKKNVKYPKAARREDIQGRIVIRFIVDTSGSVYGVAVFSKDCFVRDKYGKSNVSDIEAQQLVDEALRVVRLLPKFSPGMSDGKPIRVEFSLPINFVLD